MKDVMEACVGRLGLLSDEMLFVDQEERFKVIGGLQNDRQELGMARGRVGVSSVIP